MSGEVKLANGLTVMTCVDTGIGLMTMRKDGEAIRARIFQTPRGIAMFVYDKNFKLECSDRYPDLKTAVNRMIALPCL